MKQTSLKTKNFSIYGIRCSPDCTHHPGNPELVSLTAGTHISAYETVVPSSAQKQELGAEPQARRILGEDLVYGEMGEGNPRHA